MQRPTDVSAQRAVRFGKSARTMIGSFVFLLTSAALVSNIAQAAYTRAASGPVSVTQLYANEYGSPFV